MKRIFLSPPFVDDAERAKVAEAFDSNYVAPCGPMVELFEARLAHLAGRKYAVAVSSGTAAIELLLAHFKVDSSWIVIAPTLTFIASVGSAYRRGASLRLVDCDVSGNVDMALLETALKDACAEGRKILFIGVDLYGRCCDYGMVESLCEKYGVLFICDSAEAVGASFRGRTAGSAGIAAIYSFNGNKIITTSGGGAVLTDSKELADHVRKMSTQSRENTLWYEHVEVGFNYRMSNILAAIGLSQIEKLPQILKAKASIKEFYSTFVSQGADMLPQMDGENNWLSILFLEDSVKRDALIAALDAAGIESRPVWKPMHLQIVFSGVRIYGGQISEGLFARGICLPSGAGLSPDDLERIKVVLKEHLPAR